MNATNPEPQADADKQLAEMYAAQAEGRGQVLTGNDAMSKFVDVYLTGMATGINTAVITLLTGQDWPEDEATAAAEELVDAMLTRSIRNPITIETIRSEVTRVLVEPRSLAELANLAHPGDPQ